VGNILGAGTHNSTTKSNMVTWCEFGHAAIVTVIVLKSTGASLFLQYISKSNYKLAAHLIPVFEKKHGLNRPCFPLIIGFCHVLPSKLGM
jgi:hypothetical protein